MAIDYLIKKNYKFEKRYRVYIEKTQSKTDGFRYMKPEVAPDVPNKESFILTFYFKKNGKNNPIVSIVSIEGKEFYGRLEMVDKFRKKHALSYACTADGLDDILREDNNE
jgi:hypothetical protein